MIVSSQHYINWDIVEEKMEELSGRDCVTIPCWDIDEPEHLTGETALDAHYNDGDWYNVETSDPSTDNFDLIW